MDIMEALELVTRSIKAWTSSRLDDIDRQLDLLYQPITISSFSNTVKNMEIGDELKSISFSWKLSKDPVSQVLDGNEIDASKRSHKLDGLSITYNDYATHNFILRVTDERGTIASQSTSVKFTNKVYYGAISSDATIDSAAIRGLSGSSLENPRSLTFTTTAGSGEHVVYALPSRNGTPTFTVGLLSGGFFRKDTIEVTGEYGYKENYDIWFSENLDLGTLTVKVT